MNQPFDTSKLYSGGAFLFIQFEDVVTPIYLFAIIKLIITNISYGIPIHIIKDMSILSLTEWYIKRTHINPIQQLDYNHQLTEQQSYDLLYKILQDKSIYDYSPVMNIGPMLDVYKYKKMIIPVYIYSPYNDENIKYFCSKHFPEIPIIYKFGNLRDAIPLLENNGTFIFSNIELYKQACEFLKGKYAHVLLGGEYRYNYIDNCITPKYSLKLLMYNNPFVMTGITSVINTKALANSLQILKMKGR